MEKSGYSLKEKAEVVVSDFELYDDWMDRYQYLVDLGATLEPITDSERCDSNLIRGCQSQVWLVCENRDGRVYFRGDSDAVIVRGVVALLVTVLSDCLVSEVANTDFDFIDKIGLKEHLSPNRSNGLIAMMRVMRSYAMAVTNKNVML